MKPPHVELTLCWLEMLFCVLAGALFQIQNLLRGTHDKHLGSRSGLEVPKADRKSGVGTRAIERLEAFADQRSATIVLTPALADAGETTSRARLVRFYKRFGFVDVPKP